MSVVENRREVAYRIFAAEFDDATLSYSEGDEERAPNYVVTPTGARVNRLFAVGALTEVESVNEEVLRGRIADPTGVFVTYAGQYQPEAMNFLDRAAPPTFVSITGKARTYEPDDGDRVFTSVRPESINEVDAGTRDRWVVAAARATLERVATMKAALAMDRRGDDLRVALEARGVDESLAAGAPLAIEHYGPTEHYLEAVRAMAVQALELVADEREAVDALAVDPDEVGPDELGPLPEVPAATEPEGGDVALTEVREGDGAEESPAADLEDVEDGTAADAEATEADAGSEPGFAAADAETAATGETTEPDLASAGDEPAAETTADADANADAESSGTERETTEPGMETAADATSTPDPSEPEPTTEAPDAAEAETKSADRTAPSAMADAGRSGGDSEPSGSAGGGPGDFDGESSAPSEAAAEETAASEPTDSDAGTAGGLGDFDAGDAGTDETESVEPNAVESDADGESPAADAGETADSSGEMYEMDDDERAELEEEFGAEFSTGNEVGGPGEADIEVPDADELEAQAAEANAETNGESPSTAESAAAGSDAATDEPAAPPDDPRPDTQAPDAAAAESPETVDPSDDETGASTADDAGMKAAESAGSADAENAGADADAEDVDLEDAVVEVMADLDDGDGADREAVVAAIVDRYGADPDDVDDAIQDALMSGKCYEPNEGTLKSI